MFTFKLISISMGTGGHVHLKPEASLLGSYATSCYSYLHNFYQPVCVTPVMEQNGHNPRFCS